MCAIEEIAGKEELFGLVKLGRLFLPIGDKSVVLGALVDILLLIY